MPDVSRFPAGVLSGALTLATARPVGTIALISDGTHAGLLHRSNSYPTAGWEVIDGGSIRRTHLSIVTPVSGTAPPGQSPDPATAGALIYLKMPVNGNQTYRSFKFPTTYVSDATVHVHWTKSDDLNRLNETVRWKIDYVVFNGNGDEAGTSFQTTYLDGTYLDSSTTADNRIVYRSPAPPAGATIVGAQAGYYMSIRIGAVTPLSGTPVLDPGLFSLDLVFSELWTESD